MSKPDAPVLRGQHVFLEPLEHAHVDGLVRAGAGDRSLYQWALAPNGEAQVVKYVETALAWREAGTAVPFAILRAADGAVIGSTRFFDLATWAWPSGHARHGRVLPDSGEIGYTWLSQAAIRTAANTEAKLLLLTHAFENWAMLRVCFHTDVRNTRSRAALERIGAKPEGILRAHRLAADDTPRNSARYSLIAHEWPEVKQRLNERLGFL
jgi:RimJ/RimL family protein N-acetyltransferase